MYCHWESFMTDAEKERDLGSASITMFCGKGGVGKTTCAAAAALHYASAGRKTLAISTDATPSLSHIFEVGGDDKPKKVSESLYINELGAEEVQRMWDEKFGREVYDVFSTFVDLDYREFVRFTTSILPGLTEEFMVDFIRELSLDEEYSDIVWDTAPLGQTLALLQMPAVLLEHLKMAPRIYARLKLSSISKEPILKIIDRWRDLSADEMNFLGNRVKFVIVTIPEALAVEQLDGVFGELDKYGLRVSEVIINTVIKDDDSAFLKARAAQQRRYLDIIYNKCSNSRIIELPMFPYELKGWDRLKEVEKVLFP
jgi:arsenite-transporting ATPase